MTVPMVLWMRHRGHSWERGGEMAAAMNLPLLPLLPLLQGLSKAVTRASSRPRC